MAAATSDAATHAGTSSNGPAEHPDRPAAAASSSSVPARAPTPLKKAAKWTRFVPSTAGVVKAMISLLPLFLGIWMAYAWHRCGGFESVPMRLAAMERAALAAPADHASASSASSSASLLKMKMAAKLDSDAFVSGGASASAAAEADDFSSPSAPTAGEGSSIDISAGQIGGVLCRAGDSGWLPVIIVLLFGLRFLMERNTTFLTGTGSSAAKIAPVSRPPAGLGVPPTMPSPMSDADADDGATDPMAMLQKMMLAQGGGAGGPAGGMADGLSSLASKASAAMEAWRLVKAFAFDWLVFTTVFIVSGALLEWTYIW